MLENTEKYKLKSFVISFLRTTTNAILCISNNNKYLYSA